MRRKSAWRDGTLRAGSSLFSRLCSLCWRRDRARSAAATLSFWRPVECGHVQNGAGGLMARAAVMVRRVPAGHSSTTLRHRRPRKRSTNRSAPVQDPVLSPAHPETPHFSSVRTAQVANCFDQPSGHRPTPTRFRPGESHWHCHPMRSRARVCFWPCPCPSLPPASGRRRRGLAASGERRRARLCSLALSASSPPFLFLPIHRHRSEEPPIYGTFGYRMLTASRKSPSSLNSDLPLLCLPRPPHRTLDIQPRLRSQRQGAYRPLRGRRRFARTNRAHTIHRQISASTSCSLPSCRPAAAGA